MVDREINSVDVVIALGYTPASAASLPVASNAAPIVESTAASGTSAAYARADHVHPASGTGAFTTLTVSGTVSGAGFTNFMATPPAIGADMPGQGTFTNLSATSSLVGAGVTNRFASPGPIGNTAASTGAFTSLSASGTVSGAGITALHATPGPIGSTVPSTGAFTSLSASGTVSGVGFSNYFASPPAIGSTTSSSGAFTSLTTSGLANLNTAITNSPTAGDSSTRVPNTAWVQAFLGGANASKAASGYQKLPGGIIIQWGVATTASNGVVTVNFATAFPTAVFVVMATPRAVSVSTVATLAAQLNTVGFNLVSYDTQSGAGLAWSCAWIAIGY